MHVSKTFDPLPLDQSEPLPDYICSITKVPSRCFVQIQPWQCGYCPAHPKLARTNDAFNVWWSGRQKWYRTLSNSHFKNYQWAYQTMYLLAIFLNETVHILCLFFHWHVCGSIMILQILKWFFIYFIYFFSFLCGQISQFVSFFFPLESCKLDPSSLSVSYVGCHF